MAIDPDSEIITETVVTPGNTGDASVAEELIDDLAEPTSGTEGAGEVEEIATSDTTDDITEGRSAPTKRRSAPGRRSGRATKTAAYTKTQPPVAAAGRFAKDRFRIDLEAEQVTCPQGVAVTIRRNPDGDGIAYFADACTSCPLRSQCTDANGGRSIQVGRYEHRLAETRREQREPSWRDEYRATRPKVERKLGHLGLQADMGGWQWLGRRDPPRCPPDRTSLPRSEPASYAVTEPGILALMTRPPGSQDPGQIGVPWPTTTHPQSLRTLDSRQPPSAGLGRRSGASGTCR